MDKRQHYINGAWVDPVTPRDHPVINPATEEVIATISLGSTEDTNRAVAAAKAAFPGFAATSPAERRALVVALGEQYERREEDLAQAISMEMGAPITKAREDQAPCWPFYAKGFLKAFDRMSFETDFDGRADQRMIWEPIGPVALITPWNWPINQIVLKTVPALLAGCTMVLKPSEESPLSGMIVAEMMHDAGVPPGVFNLVNGDGPGVGTDLSTHPDIQMVSFTGSARAGKLISRNAADTLKRVTLELGGKGANLIFPDAAPTAVEDGVLDCMGNSGQSCNAPTRMLAPREIYDEVVERAGAAAAAIKVGDTTQEGPHLGPVVNRVQWEKIQDLIQSGIDEGARLVTGGPGLPEGFNKGYYVRPTVFADVTPDMRIAREEIFGPVLSVMPFEDEADAIRIANDTDYGLTNYAQTTDPDRIRRLGRALKAGMVEINGKGRPGHSFFGGVKQSGRAREGGAFGIEEYMELKAVSGWAAE